MKIPTTTKSPTTTTTTTPVVLTSKFAHLLSSSIPGGVLTRRAILIYNSTKAVFEHEIATLLRKRFAIEFEIMYLEDFSKYLKGTNFSPTEWVNERLKLEAALLDVDKEIVIAEALYEDYFLTNTTSSTTTASAPTTTTAPTTTVAPTTSSSTTEAESVTFYASLNGAQQVPPVTTSAYGTATLVFNNTTKVGVLTVSYSGLTPTAAHIHKGAVGVNGDILFPLDHTMNPIVYTTTPLTAEQEADLKAGLYYVNIHTVAHPDGEIRGQLVL